MALPENFNVLVIGNQRTGKSTVVARLGHQFEGSYQSNEDETFDISCWKFQHGTRATTVIDAPGRLEMVQPRLSGMLRRLGIFSDLVYFLYLGIPDCAMLVVSPDEFDENSREQLDRHIEMGISLQTRQWIVVVNKADVGLLEERYEHIKNWTDAALAYHPHTTVLVSAMEGHNMFEPFNGMYNWYNGQTLLAALEAIEPLLGAVEPMYLRKMNITEPFVPDQ